MLCQWGRGSRSIASKQHNNWQVLHCFDPGVNLQWLGGGGCGIDPLNCTGNNGHCAPLCASHHSLTKITQSPSLQCIFDFAIIREFIDFIIPYKLQVNIYKLHIYDYLLICQFKSQKVVILMSVDEHLHYTAMFFITSRQESSAIGGWG